MTEVAALVLAAGQGSRYRAAGGTGSKLLADFWGKPLVRWPVEATLMSRAQKNVVVVTGAEHAAVCDALAGLPVTIVANPAFAQGLATSLNAGVAAVCSSADGMLVLLGDMPGVTADLLDRLIAAFEAEPDAEAVVPVAKGHRGNPVLLSRSLVPAIATLEGDQGARKLLDERRRIVMVEAGEEALTDIDTPAALAAALR